MGYLIQLEVYEGPFDLLLDLISQNEIDIWDIPIAVITEQYLEYLYSLREQDLAITGEFLVMAATLIRIKSRLLLPEEPVEEEEADPRQELVQQLIRYKFFKDIALFLKKKYQAAIRFYPKGQNHVRLEQAPVYTNLTGDLTLLELKDIYKELFLETQKKPQVHAVTPRVSVQKRLELVRLQLAGQPNIIFSQLLADQSPLEIVVTFLAVLELARLGEIRLVQEESFGEISVEASVGV
ncbi:MAG: segregation/condensation protein A [Firmicutes bacterium]|nr:segregation/condensation protein A [Bacillota bacterium]